jgi:hypothetical protein
MPDPEDDHTPLRPPTSPFHRHDTVDDMKTGETPDGAADRDRDDAERGGDPQRCPGTEHSPPSEPEPD